MTALRVSGVGHYQMLPKKASQVIAAGAVLAFDGQNGQVTLASATSSLIAGISMETIATTDADYAVKRPMLVDMLGPSEVIQLDVTGTLTTAMVGQFLKLSDSVTADAGTAASAQSPAAALVLMCVGFISATQGLFVVNGLQATRGAA